MFSKVPVSKVAKYCTCGVFGVKYSLSFSPFHPPTQAENLVFNIGFAFEINHCILTLPHTIAPHLGPSFAPLSPAVP